MYLNKFICIFFDLIISKRIHSPRVERIIEKIIGRLEKKLPIIIFHKYLTKIYEKL